MTVYEIPLSPTPQKFTCTMNGEEYVLRVTWNYVSGCWVLDLSSATGDPIVVGVPMVTGADLLAQYQHLGLGFSLYAQTDGDAEAVPTFDNLGVNGRLLFTVQE